MLSFILQCVVRRIFTLLIYFYFAKMKKNMPQNLLKLTHALLKFLKLNFVYHKEE